MVFRFVTIIRQDALVVGARGLIDLDVGTQGETIDEALEHLCDAVELRLEEHEVVKEEPPPSEVLDTQREPVAPPMMENIGATLAGLKLF